MFWKSHQIWNNFLVLCAITKLRHWRFKKSLKLMISTLFVQIYLLPLVSLLKVANLNTQPETSIVKDINLSCIISVEWILVGGFTLLYTLGMCNTGKDTFISAVGSSSNYGLQLGYVVPLFCLFTFANMYAEAWLQRCHDFLCPVQNCLQYRR